MFKMTIFAARRALLPLLMTPANASYPLMNDTGPLAFPLPLIYSFEDLKGERLTPEPEPYLKINPSVLARWPHLFIIRHGIGFLHSYDAKSMSTTSYPVCILELFSI